MEVVENVMNMANLEVTRQAIEERFDRDN
jgi:hypothetical protein